MVLALDTSVPLRHLHSVATFPGVAPYPSYHPPPPLNFFYRIAQLLYGFALCGFHLIFGLGSPHGYVRILNNRHGLIETRECRVVADLDWLHYLGTGKQWAGLQAAVKFYAGRRIATR